MTKKTLYIQKLAKQYSISEPTAQSIYEMVNKKDWADFCSYMADYDHPEERRAAKKNFDAAKGNYSPEMQKVIDEIYTFMQKDSEYNIHHMNDEVENS